MIACSVSSWIGPPEIFHVKDNASGTTEVSQILPNWPNFRARWNILPSWMFWLFEMSPMRMKKYTLPAARRNFFPQFDGWQPKQTWAHNGLGPNLLDYAHDQLCTMYSAHYALAKTMPTINYYALAPQCTLPHYTSKLSMWHISELIQNRTTIHFYKNESHRNLNCFECAKSDKLPIYQWPTSQYTSNV